MNTLTPNDTHPRSTKAYPPERHRTGFVWLLNKRHRKFLATRYHDARGFLLTPGSQLFRRIQSRFRLWRLRQSGLALESTYGAMCV